MAPPVRCINLVRPNSFPNYSKATTSRHRRMAVKAIWRNKSTSNCLNSHRSRAWLGSSLCSLDSQALNQVKLSTRALRAPTTNKSACNSPRPPRSTSNIRGSCSTLMTFRFRRFRKCQVTRRAPRCRAVPRRPPPKLLPWKILARTATPVVSLLQALSKMRRRRCGHLRNGHRTKIGKSVSQPTKRSITCSTMTTRDSRSLKHPRVMNMDRPATPT